MITLRHLRPAACRCRTKWQGRDTDGHAVFISYELGHLGVYRALRADTPEESAQQEGETLFLAELSWAEEYYDTLPYEEVVRILWNYAGMRLPHDLSEAA